MLKTKRKAKKSKQKHSQKTTALSKKEVAAQKRKTSQKRNELLQAIAISCLVSVALGIPLLFVASPKIAVAGGAAGAILLLSYKYPRQALWAFLIYLPFSGTITYAIGGGNAAFQVAKDAFYIPALIALIQSCKKKLLPLFIPKQMLSTFSILLMMAMLTLIFVNGEMQLNPRAGDKPILQGILGLKVLIGYIPLIACTYYLLRTKKDLVFFSRMHVVLAIVCCLLGLIQYLLLESGKCAGTRGMIGEELYKATLQARCLVGGSLVFSPEVKFIRLPGTFVAPWQWAWFLISNAFITFASAFCDPSFWWRVIGLFGMALVFANAVISGQRAALVMVPVATAILLVLTGQLVNLKRLIPIVGGLAILLFVGAAINPGIIEQRLESVVSRWNAAPPLQFLFNQFEQSNNFIIDRPLGRGVGRATNSTRIFGTTQLIETFQPKLIYELGYPGMIAFQIMLLHLAFLTFRAYRSVKDKSLRSYGASFWVFVGFITLNTQYYPLDVDPVSVYYWVLAGAILKLPTIDKQVQDEKHQELESNDLQVHQQLKEKKIIASAPI
ncbi:hormogonium polysaccharide biosynthesis protein HpsL [Microcoleus sp. OTE_8_concoct_300]|uniref:hormogonium polysaccharide biosynthesis protein HpsL n=1 Tax=Microcoleus sp. OTE_8_concoct_300 TaxID=2964710 RepID=UPI00403F0E11